jgi:arabinofuranan 3-O-arabinosyltransferase
VNTTLRSAGPGVAGWIRRRTTAISVGVLAVLAYLPALRTAPDRMPADSKLYVYLNPGRFLSDTVTTFDPRQFAGWVPHQHIAYLWPTGPWFWLFERLGVPDWVAHRLWIGTLFLAAGLGVRWAVRVLGLSPLAALVAALVYQLSPYVLPYVSRTSVLLLPWAGLGWIVGCTVLATRRGGWRYPGLVALVVLTVGAVNATALLMVVPAPLLWLVHSAWRGDITWRRAGSVALKVAVLSTAVSLWWMAMLVIQSRHGADVLAYSESLAAVSFTSTSTEVARGLGYWLFYIRDVFGATTTASFDHLMRARIIAAGFTIVVVGVVGVVASRWAHRRYAAGLIGVGTVLAVGVHPIDDPSPLMSLLVGDEQGGFALAIRSSTRAVPVLLLGSALGAALLVDAVRARGWRSPVVPVRAEALVAATIGVLAMVNLPALRSGGLVDPLLERDPDPPQSWLDATAALDALPPGYRVLQLPGTEFGAYQWGYTVDQPLPALTERALVTRDLLPLGSAAAMDLTFALDDRFQDGIAEPAAIAPVARLLGVDTVWVTGDIDAARFRLPRPEIVDDLLTGGDVDGLSTTRRFGEPVVMVPTFPLVDEHSLGDRRIGTPIAPVSLVTITDPVPTARVKLGHVIVVGDGAGIVDAAAAGVIDGTELIRYSASLADDRTDALAGADRIIVTDSNRDRARHWRGSQDTTGFTESGGIVDDVLRFDSGDQRLPVFPRTETEQQTVSVQDGPVTAAASAYGEPFAYLPERRPAMAIDGDVATAWTVGDRFAAVGEFLELTTAAGIDHVTLRQPDSGPGDRTINRVDITVDDRSPLAVALDERSLSGGGQRIDLEPTNGPTALRITIAGTTEPQPPIGPAIGGVGFAEVDVGLGPTTEYIRPPVDWISDDATGAHVTMVLTRLRTDPADRWRSDPEPELRRRVELDRDMSAELTVTVRLDRRADGAVLGELLGEPARDDAHLTGVPTARGAAALDDDPTTAWITPVDRPVGPALTFEGTGTATIITIDQPGGDTSPVTMLRLTDALGTVEVEVPATAPSDPSSVDVELPRSVDLSRLTVQIAGADVRTTLDRRFGEPVELPVSIAELRFDGASPAIRPAAAVLADCRTDLLAIDGRPVGMSFAASVDDLLAGVPVEVDLCDPPPSFSAGTNDIVSTTAGTGLQVDRVIVTEAGDRADGARVLVPEVTTATRQRRVLEVPPCPDGCWVVLGEGFNPAWTADSDGTDLGAPQLVDGNANGWYLEPSSSPRTVTVSWTAQRPVTLALVLSLLAALATIVLVALDRRRDHDTRPDDAPPALVPIGEVTALRPAVATAAAGLVAAALLIGWQWAAIAALIGLPTILLRRTRLTGWFGVLIVAAAGVVVTSVVRDERPFPNAGWPMRFDWLHGWTLLGVLLITCATLFARDARRLDSGSAGHADRASAAVDPPAEHHQPEESGHRP